MYFYTCVLCLSIIFFYTVASFLIHQFLYPHSISHLFFSFLFCSRVLNTLVLNTWSNRVRPIVVSCFALPDHFLTLIPALKQYGDRDFIQILKEALLTQQYPTLQTQTTERCPHSILCQKPNTIGEKEEKCVMRNCRNH